MKTRLARVVGPAALVVLSACQPEPSYNDDLGLQPVAIAAGELTGTFARKAVRLNVSDLPVLGEQLTGGEVYALVTRTFESDAYKTTTTLCSGKLYEVAGTTSVITDEQYQTIDVSTPDIDVDHTNGLVTMENVVELTALELEDPVNDDMPRTKEEAVAPPHIERIYDADDDGELGMTMTVSGLGNGDIHYIDRTTSGFTGVVLSKDRIVGTFLHDGEMLILSATDEQLEVTYDEEQHPDPKESWFEEVRLAENANCDDVVEAVSDGTVSRLKPFDDQ